MMEHSESAFYQPDEITFKENREFTKLYHERIGTGQEKGNCTARKKLKLSSTSKKVCMHNKENSQWHSFNKLVNKKLVWRREQRERESGETSEIKTMQFLKSLTTWLQIRKTFNGFQLKISFYRRGSLLIFIANATTKVTYRKLAIQFGQCKSSRQNFAPKVVKTELKLYFR